MKFNPILCVLICSWVATIHAETVILKTTKGGETEIIGDKKLAGRAVTPASTFKIVIAWAALEKKLVNPKTKHLCKDKFLPGTPRELTMKEAMFHSSNDYFLWLARDKIGLRALTQDIRNSDFFEEYVPDDWYGKDESSASHAGVMKTTARKQHEFIQQVASEKLASNHGIQQQLLEIMKWPSSNPEMRLYGKTGSYEGAYWFNGFAIENDEWTAVTVLCMGVGASRDVAIETFYKQFDLPKPKL